MIELAGAMVPFIVMAFPSRMTLDYEGQNYTFHFKDECRVLINSDCGGWVRVNRNRDIFIVKDGDMGKIREVCNHEMAHVLMRGTGATAEHEFIYRNRPRYEVCDRLVGRLG